MIDAIGIFHLKYSIHGSFYFFIFIFLSAYCFRRIYWEVFFAEKNFEKKEIFFQVFPIWQMRSEGSIMISVKSGYWGKS